MNTEFWMYKCFKGETENPFDNEKENTQHMFWFYESVFEREFNKNESSDWYSFFSDHEMGNDFMKILSEEDYNRPTIKKKKDVFELWLIYLFNFKLYPEYGGENSYKKLYDLIK